MNDELTHKIEIIITGNYPHGEKQHARVAVTGDGQLSHMLGAFRAALLVAGYGVDTVQQLRIDG